MKAPRIATAPPTSHADIVSPAVPARCATTAGLRKIPEPMMPPTTIIVPSNTPMRRA